MKISIVTVTYNAADTLADAASSLFKQTYPDIEYIIIDGGSSDGTETLVSSFGKKVTRYISEPDKGIFDAMNKGIAESTGDIVGFLHADDKYARNDALDLIAKQFETEACDAVYSDLDYVKKGNTQKVVRHWKSGDFQSGLINRGWMPPHPTFHLKRDLYALHGVFDLYYPTSADYDQMLRVLGDESLKIGYVPEVLVKMRTGGNSNGSIKKLYKKYRDDYLIMRDFNFPFPLFALMNKNFSKISQFWRK